MRKSLSFAFLLAVLLLLLPTAADARRPQRSRVRFETTMGDFTIELYNETPLHRDNFLRLVRSGHYDGLLFHRVIDHFMVQTGDPDSREAKPGQSLGDGDVPYTVPAEFRLPQLFHERGAVAAAREGDDVNPERRSSGAQFYVVWGKRFDDADYDALRERVDAALPEPMPVTHAMRRAYRVEGGTPHLDGLYTVFGRVVRGLRVIGRIERVKTDAQDRPLTDVRIRRAYVLE